MSDMARTSTIHLSDRILDGGLQALLLGWREEGVSVTDMAFRLRERDVKVAPETVRRWLHRIDREAAA
jgi:transposase-like protein